MSTTDSAGTIFGLFRLGRGVRLQTFLTHLRVSVTGQGPEQVEAGRIVAGQATMLGGINTIAGRPATFTQALRPGIHYLINYTDFLKRPDRPVTVHPITVAGPQQACLPPRPSATIHIVDTPGGSRYRAPTQLVAGTAVLVRNSTDHVDEAVFMPIKPDATEADIRRFFQPPDPTQPRPTNPFTAQEPRGMPVMHHHRFAIIEPNLEPGRYALLTFLPDANGRSRAATGSLAIITVR